MDRALKQLRSMADGRNILWARYPPLMVVGVANGRRGPKGFTHWVFTAYDFIT